MVKPTVTVTKRGSGIKGLNASLAQLRRTDVLVGIPASNEQRKDDEINNPSLLFILTHGSPVHNIPATPIVEPAIERSKSLWSPELASAAKAMLDRNPTLAATHLKRAGTIAVNACKRIFTDNDWPANAPSTIARKDPTNYRRYKSGKITWQELEDGVNRNINTGQLRRAFSYVLRQGDVETPQETVEAGRVSIGAPSEAVESSAEEAVTIGGEVAEIL